MKIKDLIFEAPPVPTTPLTPGAPKPTGLQTPVGNVPASGAPVAGQPATPGATPATPGATPATVAAPGQPIPPNQQVGQPPAQPGQPAIGQPPQDPKQQLNLQAATITQNGTKEPAVAKLAPGFNFNKQTAQDLAVLGANPKATTPIPPSLQKLIPGLARMVANGDPQKVNAAAQSAQQPVK